MPRRARLRLAGIPVHLIQRGNNRAACFFADGDYALYLDHLETLARKYGCQVHAYVLMTNHVHLLLTPIAEDSASLMMKHLGQRYVQYINRSYRRSGTLWEGRFKSCLTQSASYVLACYRYIELNPVRAGMVTRPGDYRWSSFLANAHGKSDRLLTPHEEFLRLGSTAEARRAAYRALIADRLEPETVATIRSSTNGNIALGSLTFQSEVEATLGRRARPGRPGRPCRERCAEVVDQAVPQPE
jgi:putative transposase